jgi:hypothetical protein
MKGVLLTAVCILFSFHSAHSQSGSHFLLRMERAQPGETACVLVNDNGSYRLERILQNKQEMYAGAFDAARMDQLRAMLANQQLSGLSQSDIRTPLITDTFDDLQIAIDRSGGWQELAFSSPASRKPFRDSIDPLLRWFQDVKKQYPSATRLDGQPTHCMPGPEIQMVPGAPSVTAAHSSATNAESAASQSPPLTTVTTAAGGYLFRINSSHYYKGRVDGSCTVVLENGHYRRERSDQRYRADRRDKIAEGELDPEAIHQLKELLDSRGLKDSPGNPGNPERHMREGTRTELAIPRGGEVQHLLFLTMFNTRGIPDGIGGTNNLAYHVADLKLLEPLTQWMEQHTDKQAQVAESDGVGNDCYPSKAVVEAGKAPR